MIDLSFPIYVYQDPIAVNPTCAQRLTRKVLHFGVNPSRIIPLPDNSYLIKSFKDKKASIIFPGGRTSCLIMDLEKNASKIREVVDKGWGFLGSCAGANYASASMSITDPQMGHIKDFAGEFGGRFLHLLPIHAKSPAYSVKAMGTTTVDNSRRISVHVESSKEMVEVIWNEGSTFAPLPGCETAVTLEASYTDIAGRPACAYSGKFGLGNVVITAVHPELIEDSIERAVDPLLSRLFQLIVLS